MRSAFVRVLLSLIAIAFIVFSCSPSYEDYTDDNPNADFVMNNKDDSLLGMYYYFVDTLIRFPNEVIIKCSKLDTTIREEGIFTFLKYDFVMYLPEELVRTVRTAVDERLNM